VLACAINFDQCSSSLRGLKDKLEEVLNVKVAQQQREAQSRVDSYQTALAGSLGSSAVEVKVDWSFTQHDKFLAKSLNERAKLCALATERCGALVTSSDGYDCTSSCPNPRGWLTKRVRAISTSQQSGVALQVGAHDEGHPCQRSQVSGVPG
jgi:hypothetical protein